MASGARFLSLCITLALPAGAMAHPHVFVDTALRLELDADRRVTAVEVTWKYDDLYSLLIMQDMGVDDDGDGRLTDAELATIQGWDMQWIDGYAGDLYLTGADGKSVSLSQPEPISTGVEDARLISRHRRTLETPVDAGNLTLRAFDPEFYTAYDLTLGVTLPEPCTANVVQPDQDSAYAEAMAIMAAFPEDAVEVPMLGHVFAETVTLTCRSGN